MAACCSRNMGLFEFGIKLKDDENSQRGIYNSYDLNWHPDGCKYPYMVAGPARQLIAAGIPGSIGCFPVIHTVVLQASKKGPGAK